MKRLVLALAAFVLLASPAHAAIARVASQASGAVTDSGTSVAKAYPVNVTSGNLLVVCTAKYSTSTDAYVLGDISKSAGTATVGTWTMDGSQSQAIGGGPFIHSACYSVPVTGTGSCTVTVAGALASSALVIAVNEYTGADTGVSRAEANNSGGNTTGTPVTGSSSSAAGAVFVGMLGTATVGSTTHTAGSGYNAVYEEENGALHPTGNCADQIVTVGTTDTADWTAPTTVPWTATLVVYKEAAAAAGTTAGWTWRW